MGFWPSGVFSPAAGWVAGKPAYSRLFGSRPPATLSLLQVLYSSTFSTLSTWCNYLHGLTINTIT